MTNLARENPGIKGSAEYRGQRTEYRGQRTIVSNIRGNCSLTPFKENPGDEKQLHRPPASAGSEEGGQ
jgi:hypothetical protein